MNLMERVILDDNKEDDFTNIYNHFRLPVLKNKSSNVEKIEIVKNPQFQLFFPM